MWESLSQAWKACFEEAWESFRNGQFRLELYLLNENEPIVYRGRDRVNEIYTPEYQTCSNRLAHAEINVLLQVRQTDSDQFQVMCYTRRLSPVFSVLELT
ncbi:hypothetical protein GCM10025859_41860 [Alicyclobacillus fastidiosus]|nr:hypothetical protein GCM10025859_41860 [Alicyclobacillus fastidiosus]